MSWSFTQYGRDKEALKKACIDCLEMYGKPFNNSVATQASVDKVMGVIADVIDAAIKPDGAYCLKVKTSGVIDKDQCYFGVTVTPIYLPLLVRDTISPWM
jgi:hypothetical protein